MNSSLEQAWQLAKQRYADSDVNVEQALALLEEQKSLPWQAVWDRYCQQHQVPVGSDWLSSVREYEQTVLSQR